MGAGLYDLSPPQDNDTIRAPCRRQAMGDQDGRSADHQRLHGILNFMFGFRINVRGGLVKNN